MTNPRNEILTVFGTQLARIDDPQKVLDGIVAYGEPLRLSDLHPRHQQLLEDIWQSHERCED